MNVQRFTQLTARRILQRPSSLTSVRYHAPAITSPFRALKQSRPATSQTAPPPTESPRPTNIEPTEADAILMRQRRSRPISPHLSIYQTQIPWVMSGLNRIAGSLLSGAFYLFGFTYLISPLFGWHMESSALAESFAQLPTAVRGGLKFMVALPFTYHGFNGMRHLVWDSGRELANKSVVRTGWVVMGLTVVCSTGLAVYGT